MTDVEQRSLFPRHREERVREDITEQAKRVGARKRTPSAAADPAERRDGEGWT